MFVPQILFLPLHKTVSLFVFFTNNQIIAIPIALVLLLIVILINDIYAFDLVIFYHFDTFHFKDDAKIKQSVLCDLPVAITFRIYIRRCAKPNNWNDCSLLFHGSFFVQYTMQ